MAKKLNYEAMTSQVSEIDWARLAAFIDGEGTIYINRQKARKPSWSPRYFLQVVITNTNPVLMTWLKDTFFGSVYYVKDKSNKFSKKQVMRWQMNGRIGAIVLTRCLPYFVMKKAQAEVGIAFENLKTVNWSRRKVCDSDLAVREQHRLAIHKLNSSQSSAVQ